MSETLDNGGIEIIVGCMFSRKTDELLLRLDRHRIAEPFLKRNGIIKRVGLFKPTRDKRWGGNAVVESRSGRKSPAVFFGQSEELLALGEDYEVMGVEELQFLDPKFPQVANTLARRGRRIIGCGLDLDFEGKPFPVTAESMAIANVVTKLTAICALCGKTAFYSQRLTDCTDLIMVGDGEYEPRCLKCFKWPEAA